MLGLLVVNLALRLTLSILDSGGSMDFPIALSDNC